MTIASSPGSCDEIAIAIKDPHVEETVDEVLPCGDRYGQP
jgi:hypothetical protein